MRENLPEDLKELEARLRSWQPASSNSTSGSDTTSGAARLLFEAGRRRGKESPSRRWSPWATVAALLVGLGLGSLNPLGSSDERVADAPDAPSLDSTREFEPSQSVFDGITDRSSYASLTLALASGNKSKATVEELPNPNTNRDVLTPRSVIE